MGLWVELRSVKASTEVIFMGAILSRMGIAATAAAQSWRERVGALRNLPPFLQLVWHTSRALTLGTLLLRLVRALLPVVTLFVGKLIIDEVIVLAQTPGPPQTLRGWYTSGLVDRLLWLLAAELALAVLSDVLGRAVSLLDSLLSEQFSNTTSVRLMEHAATLDLEDFEDSELQDRLERARRQASGRMTLTSQLFGQAQDVVTILRIGPGRTCTRRATGSPTPGPPSSVSSITCARPAPAWRARRR